MTRKLANNKPNLKLINNNGMRGYTISNIKEVLNPKRFEQLEKWILGQTVMRYKGEDLVYEYDLERFLKGLPTLD